MKRPAAMETLPLSRIGTLDVGVIGRRKHHIVGLLEVDVTNARDRLRRMRREGTPVSFTSWFVKSVADAVEESPEVHGVLRGRSRRVLFEEVDVTLMVERKLQGRSVPLPLVIWDSARLTLEEVHSAIGDTQEQPLGGAEDYELGRRRSRLFMTLFYYLPQSIRVWIMERILKDPERRKATMGTVMVTSVAAGLRFAGWIIPKSMHNLVFGLGSIVRKPRVLGDTVMPREVLHLTVLLDHDVVDGAPAARFVSKLVRALEQGTALPEA